jgi:alkylation response protein AidB-like acyl-CoA dehydrogenase
MGLRGSDTVEVVFEDCIVPPDQMLGEPTGGFKTFMRTLTGGRISIGALALGIAQGAYEHALSYSKIRHQFGQSISNFQGVQFMLADMAVKLEAARHLVLQRRASCATWAGSTRRKPRWPSSTPARSATG